MWKGIFLFIILVLVNSAVSNKKNNSPSDQRTRGPSQLMSRYPYWESFGEFDGSTCTLDRKTKREIKSYQEIVDYIMSSTAGKFKGDTYKHLSHFTDNFGSRLVTSSSYSKAAAFFIRQMLKIPTLSGRVFVEDVSVPDWER